MVLLLKQHTQTILITQGSLEKEEIDILDLNTDVLIQMDLLKVEDEITNKFISHLSTLDPNNENPLFKEWYQSEYECFLDASSPGIYKTKCEEGKSLTQSKNFKLSPTTTYMLYLFRNLGDSLVSTLSNICGSVNGVCEEYWSGNSLLLRENLMKLLESRVGGYRFVIDDTEVM